MQLRGGDGAEVLRNVLSIYLTQSTDWQLTSAGVFLANLKLISSVATLFSA